MLSNALHSAGALAQGMWESTRLACRSVAARSDATDRGA
jgi:hypothetical protein